MLIAETAEQSLPGLILQARDLSGRGEFNEAEGLLLSALDVPQSAELSDVSRATVHQELGANALAQAISGIPDSGKVDEPGDPFHGRISSAMMWASRSEATLEEILAGKIEDEKRASLDSLIRLTYALLGRAELSAYAAATTVHDIRPRWSIQNVQTYFEAAHELPLIPEYAFDIACNSIMAIRARALAGSTRTSGIVDRPGGYNFRGKAMEAMRLIGNPDDLAKVRKGLSAEFNFRGGALKPNLLRGFLKI